MNRKGYQSRQTSNRNLLLGSGSVLDTQIVVTLGPPSSNYLTFSKICKAGKKVAVRLNMSYGTQSEHKRSIDIVRTVEERNGWSIPIIADLQGAKMRIGGLPSGGILLETGLTVTLGGIQGILNAIPVPGVDLNVSVHPGDHILLDDGKMEIQAVEVANGCVTCEVIAGGQLTSLKGITFPSINNATNAGMSRKDYSDARFAVEAGVDWIALSYVRSRQEIRMARTAIEDVMRNATGAYRPYLMTKIETSQAVETLDEIIEDSDALMVARGDLGLEVGLEKVPLIQKLIIGKGNRAGLPVVTATQMFESMIKESRPTRAEVTDVHNAILEGTSAVMLSGETAIGKHPVEAVRHMRNIIEYLADESLAPKFATPELLPLLHHHRQMIHVHPDRISGKDFFIASPAVNAVS